MLSESFIAATSAVHKAPQHLTAALKDVGIFQYQFQPYPGLRQTFKKSSVGLHSLALSKSHIFAAQLDKAVINVYSREKANQEATVPFPDRVRSLVFVEAAAVLIIGTESGKLILWEVATGRLVTTSPSHLQAVSSLQLSPNSDYLLSGSPDATVCIWSLPLLLSFSSNDPNSYGNDTATATRAPCRVFSAHRSSITALSCAHSRPATNFAISASQDNTCYIWHIETCEIIRTILLPSTPVCATLDPVDRAIYFGSQDGGIMSVNLQSLATKEPSQATIELLSKDIWAPASQLGAANAISLSYDATVLLSAHANGAVVQWDVAKQRIASEIFNFGQPVTNIQMLRPQGLPETEITTGYVTPAIVKPKLELNHVEYGKTVAGVPTAYSLHVSLTGPSPQSFADQKFLGDEVASMTSDGWSATMLDHAIHAIETATADPPQPDTSSQATKTEKLQEEVAALKQQIAIMHKVEQKRIDRTFDKLRRLDALDARRKQAYFDAKSQGKDGDAAMKPFDKEIEQIRRETGDHDDLMMDNS